MWFFIKKQNLFGFKISFVCHRLKGWMTIIKIKYIKNTYVDGKKIVSNMVDFVVRI